MMTSRAWRHGIDRAATWEPVKIGATGLCSESDAFELGEHDVHVWQ